MAPWQACANEAETGAPLCSAITAAVASDDSGESSIGVASGAAGSAPPAISAPAR